MNVLFPVRVQVDGVALVQGVQEGREMNAPPLPLEERQQSERISSTAASENTEECGSLLFVFFFLSLFFWRTRRENDSSDHQREKLPTHLSSSWTSSPVISSHKVSRIWERLLSFFQTTQTADARGVFGAEFKKKRKKENAAEERGK